MEFKVLREKHKQLIYQGFGYKLEDGNLEVEFDFLLTPDIQFKPKVVLPKVGGIADKTSLDTLVFNLGLVEILSYWKTACPPQIVVKAGFLNEEQIAFWKKLLIKGLGEFFFNNKIDFTQEDLVEFVIDSDEKFLKSQVELIDRDLILIGGGKDSAVTLELISKSGKDFNVLMLNPNKAALKISEAAGCKNPITAKRIIDPKLFELNEQRYLNGHTPFSAYLAFLASLAGVVYDYKNIVVSNESSSNEANVIWLDQPINHQYSKSEEFEKDFQGYSQKYLANTQYYSYLRSLNELQISEKFSKMEKYHSLFRSCNIGAKLGIWCGKCPKCVSTYLTLYPFLGEKTKEIFGLDLLNDESLMPILKGLLRENDVVKPFECVATIEEIKTAILLGIERAKKDGQEIPKLLKIYAP